MFAATHERTPSATTRSVAPTGGLVVPVCGPGAVVVVVRFTVVVVVGCGTGTVVGGRFTVVVVRCLTGAVVVVFTLPEWFTGSVVDTTGGMLRTTGTVVVAMTRGAVVVVVGILVAVLRLAIVVVVTTLLVGAVGFTPRCVPGLLSAKPLSSPTRASAATQMNSVVELGCRFDIC